MSLVEGRSARDRAGDRFCLQSPANPPKHEDRHQGAAVLREDEVTETSLRKTLKGPRAPRIGWLNLSDPILAEISVLSGFEAVLVDLQHGTIDMRGALDLVTSIRARGGHALARVPVGAWADAARLLDYGAELVVAPMIETAEEARRFASFVKYPPLGMRSWGPLRAMQVAGLSAPEYLRTANAETLALVMIETRKGLDGLDAILAEPGIDGVLVGPYDLSIALSSTGEPGVDRADTVAAMRMVAQATRAAGKIAGAYGPSVEHVRRFLDFGYDFATLCVDADLLPKAIAAAIAAVEA